MKHPTIPMRFFALAAALLAFWGAAFPAAAAGTRSITLNDAVLGLSALRFPYDQETLKHIPNLSTL